MSDPVAATPANPDEMSFEQALARLEKIVQRLETGEESLDSSITLYEEADRMRRRCEDRLREAQMKIEKITLGADGRPTGTAPLDDREA